MIPAGVTTATVHLDAPVSFTGDPGRIHIIIAPSVPLVWTATGTPMGNFIDTISLNPGVDLDLQLPHTDQPGFEDGFGNAYTGWYYTVTVVYEKDGQRIDFPAKDFQVPSGQGDVDLALIPAGEAAPVPEVAPILPVTSWAGRTGAVVPVKAEVGLGNVNNTSDADKPVSVLQQLALDAKLDDSQLGAASGVAPLDSGSRVPQVNLPAHLDPVSLSATIASAVPAAVNPLVPPLVQAQVPPAVTTALAADSTVANAAASAVSAAIAGRPIQEGGAILEDTLSFAVVDEDGRRTDIETGTDGKFTQRAVDSLAPRIGTSMGLQDINSAVSGLGFVVTDEDGRRTEIEVGEDGKFTKRVIDSINARLTFPSPPVVIDPTRLDIPGAVPMLVGQTYKLYFRDFIDALDANYTVLPNAASNGVNYGTYWQYTPTTAKSFNLILNVFDKVGALVKQKTVPITVYTAPAATGKRHMAIGDSITRAGNYSGLAASALTGVTTVGTRTYDDGQLNVEGRGGWTLSNYFTWIGRALEGDSPFLFPTNVSDGAKFWGNTEFWRKVSNVPMSSLPSSGYDFDGFQKMARGWAAAGGTVLYDVNGYPKAPTEGDVVVDPTKAAGAQWLQYTSGAWTTIATPTVEFSFSKYMQRYAAAFPNGGPTSISLMLQTNDFYNGVDDAGFALWKSRLDTVIASVRAWSATVPFIILLAPAGGPPQNWALQSYHNKFEHDRYMRDSANRIMAAYDNSTNQANKVYVATFLGTVSAANMQDHVHPVVPTGHAEMSPYLAGMLAKLITEGA